ncbi:Thiamin pyrophosphokinase 1 [Tritrichomonas foetus]|uniref:Thiamin pyrophosphokinase 1 n=1 Tax=Tritrichomonas foetus TaxID=1144522 RepID=A0A1J4JLN3_9EUKA|nr:Thiamin pyrophosphokinase 1 [Tritrichomonas foetus]|eukprot:OHS99593.1 Thiamin pyrophosphokinase 1 [Tritrichomonas foetus]
MSKTVKEMIRHPMEDPDIHFTLLVLNYKLPRFFEYVWSKADSRVCADGGINRVLNYFAEKGVNDYTPPNYVVGDFDSVNQSVRQSVSEKGCEFIEIHDQDFNDIEKSLSVISRYGNTENPVIVLGAYGGRLDHTLAALKAGIIYQKLRIFYLDDDNFSTWIFPGDKGVIRPNVWTRKTCGLLPAGIPVKHVKTSGLRWNCDFGLSMHTIISSSNEFADDAEYVEIETSDPILWTNQAQKYEVIFPNGNI